MHLEPFPIYIEISFSEKQTWFVEHVPVSSREEHFWVKRAEDTIVLSSNRPLYRNKGLKKRRGDYEVISGQMHNIGLFNKIVDAIEAKKDLWDRNTLPGENVN
jgi:hypothetical protein